MTSHCAHHFLISAVRERQLTQARPEPWPSLNQYISSIKVQHRILSRRDACASVSVPTSPSDHRFKSLTLCDQESLLVTYNSGRARSLDFTSGCFILLMFSTRFSFFFSHCFGTNSGIMVGPQPSLIKVSPFTFSWEETTGIMCHLFLGH